MAAISITAAEIGLVFPESAVVRTYIAAEALTKGQPVYYTAAGKVGLCDTNDAGKQQFRGIALDAAAAGQAVDVVQEGEVYGFDLSGEDADGFVYVSDAEGYADTGGTMTVAAGRVVHLPDKDLTPVLRVFVRWDTDWS